MTKRSKEERERYWNWEPGDVTVTSASGEVKDVSMPEVTDEQKAAVEAAIEFAPEDAARDARIYIEAGQWPAAAEVLGLDLF